MFASVGSTLIVFSLERGGLKAVSKFAPEPSTDIMQISWCHDNSYIAILQEDEFPQIISMKDPGHPALVHTISSVSEVTALKFKWNTKRLLAIGTRSGEVMLYDTKNRCVSTLLGQLSTEITSLEFISSDELAITSQEALVVFNLTESTQTTLFNPATCTALKCFNKSARQVIVGCSNGMVIIWDVGEKMEVKTFHLHSAKVTGISLSNRDKLVITSGEDNKMCIIDNSTQECIFKKIFHQSITAIDLNFNEHDLVVGLQDGSIYVYQMADYLKPQICLRMHSTSVNQLSFMNGPIMPMELMESDSIAEEQNGTQINDKGNDNFSSDTAIEQTSIEDIAAPQQEIEQPTTEGVEIAEEKVKMDLMKLINTHFGRLEVQAADHCGRLQALVSSELDSLYAVAARWECFKTMELEDIVRYICGIVSASSDTRIPSQKSEHTGLQ